MFSYKSAIKIIGIVGLVIVIAGVFTYLPTILTNVRSVVQNTIDSSGLLAQTPELEVDKLLITLDELMKEVIALQSEGVTAVAPQSNMSASCLELTRDLKVGSRDTATNNEVTLLQQFLVKSGHMTAKATGYYGPQTSLAVRKFQIREGLISPDTETIYSVGAVTRQKIKEKTCGAQTEVAQTVTIQQSDLNPLPPGQTIETSPVNVKITSLGTAYPSFGIFQNTSFFDTQDMTLRVTVDPGKTIYYRGITGLNKSFHFKGGAYPGTSGTCKEQITDACTLVITFRPAGELGEPFGIDSLQVQTSIEFGFTDSEQRNGNSAPFALRGYTPAVPGHFRMNGIGEDNTLTLTPLRAGLSHKISSELLVNGLVRDVSVEPFESPFHVVDDLTCSSQSLVAMPTHFFTRCVISWEYRPVKEGKETQALRLTYNNGIQRVTDQFFINAQAFARSDTDITPEDNLLIVYNEKSEDSTRIADYYVKNRPGFSKANVISIKYPEDGCVNCPSPDDETALIVRFNATVRNPIAKWIQDHPEKDIRHIVLVRGIPTRVTDPTLDKSKMLFPADSISSGFALANYYQSTGACKGYNLLTKIERANTYYAFDGECYKLPTKNAAGYFEREKYPGMLALVTSLDMGSTEATLKYIDKLKDMYNRMPSRSLFISAQNTGKAGTTYYLEDKGASARIKLGAPKVGEEIKSSLAAVNPQVKIDYRPLESNSYLTDISNVAGLFTWGANGRWYPVRGFDPDYALNGSITMSGDSSWYLIQTAESYNGKLAESYQGNYRKWFSENAFGGRNYQNTPAAAVVHVDEPGLLNINDRSLFQCWEMGDLFIDCAWYSRLSQAMQAVGDPWIRK